MFVDAFFNKLAKVFAFAPQRSVGVVIREYGRKTVFTWQKQSPN